MALGILAVFCYGAYQAVREVAGWRVGIVTRAETMRRLGRLQEAGDGIAGA